MIFVTVGLMFGFENLIKEMDNIAGVIEEKVVMQIGNTSYEPKYAEYFRFASKKEIDVLYYNARVVVCHAGVGSILTALEHDKPVIAVPRRKKYGESVDDHQLEIAKELEREEKITVIYDVRELERALLNVSDSFGAKIEPGIRLAKALREYLIDLNKN
ncbi:UDP-N-acetylglucosamine--N-acetylmuramyl-(pentapeptide) pyrophosphoryl-undecaprenol N-acetylglucosamine transferase [uncultured archaeon]|nr:UDP-N-acetylglucosamine--N-acetylmuramyl-(pentapeptide) pyrophosphoryl-undecaprenol N-acetylglucosamine transferase [uncultured archaeon]